MPNKTIQWVTSMIQFVHNHNYSLQVKFPFKKKKMSHLGVSVKSFDDLGNHMLLVHFSREKFLFFTFFLKVFLFFQYETMF